MTEYAISSSISPCGHRHYVCLPPYSRVRCSVSTKALERIRPVPARNSICVQTARNSDAFVYFTSIRAETRLGALPTQLGPSPCRILLSLGRFPLDDSCLEESVERRPPAWWRPQAVR